MKKFKFFALAAALMMAAACSEPLDEAAEVNAPQPMVVDADESANVVPDEGPIVLGDKLPNPYSMENMRKAIAELQSRGLSKAALSTDIKPTHYYMRFKPKNEAEVDAVEADTTVFYYSFPLDREIVGGSTNYRDPELPDSVPSYMYCTVPVDHVLPNVEHEILEELYILEDVNVYDDPNEDEAIETSLSKNAKASYWPELKNIALEMVGMEPETVSLSKSWKPKGRVTYYDNSLNKTIPLQGAPVRTMRAFIGHQCCTDANGNFSMPKVNCKHTFLIRWKRADFKIRRKTGLDAAELVIASKVKKTTINFSIGTGLGLEWKIASVFRGILFYYDNGSRYALEKPMWEMKIRVSDSYNSDLYFYNRHETTSATESTGYIYANSLYKSNDLFCVGNAIIAQAFHEAFSYDLHAGNYWFYRQTDNDLKKDWGKSAGWYMTRKQYPNYTGIMGRLSAQYMKDTDSDVAKIFVTLNESKTFDEFDRNYKKH